jgi:hypothetical protein
MTATTSTSSRSLTPGQEKDDFDVRAKKMNPKTALFVGAGAVERAWDPVVAALQHFSPVVINADQASCMLALTRGSAITLTFSNKN